MAVGIDRVQFRPGRVAAHLQERSVASLDLSVDLVARRDLQRYYALLEKDLSSVDLSPAEAMLCCEALSREIAGLIGAWRTAGAVLGSIMGAIQVDALDKKFEVDGEALIAKVVSWTAGQRFAVSDAVERWWLVTRENSVDVEDSLVKVGLVRPSEELGGLG